MDQIFEVLFFNRIFLSFLLVLETPLIMCERNCHGLTCTILLKKLNFLLAIFALEQGGKGGARLRAVPYNKLNKFYVRAV